jgi:AraC-like DNA-binding protein
MMREDASSRPWNSSSLPPAEVSGILVRALSDTVTRFDVAADALLDVVTDLSVVGPPTRPSAGMLADQRLPLAVFGRMLERAATLTREPAIALLCGFDARECAFDLLAPLVSHVSTMRHAVQETSQFHSLALAKARLELTERAGVARLRCEFPRSYDSTDRSVAEFMVAGLLRMIRLFGGGRNELKAACFEHARPSYAQAYTQICHGVEKFGQSFTGVEFAAELLDRPHLHANPELQTAAHAQAEQRLGRLARPTAFLDRLKSYLINQPPPGVPDMDAAAQAFGMSSRSLRRRLMEEGVSYRALTQDMQGQRACVLLRNPNFTIQTVAGMLGFTDTGAFHRAFRRWSGMSAVEYRQSLGIAAD